MLKLTKKTDYALMALHHIGYLTDQPLVNAKEIAETYHIPVEMMAKILQVLSRDGLIASVNGPKGGYTLSRPPEEISVADVITAIEGQIGVADCLVEMHAPCMQADTCTIRTPVEHIQERIVALLAGLSVAELHHMAGGAAKAVPLAITG